MYEMMQNRLYTVQCMKRHVYKETINYKFYASRKYVIPCVKEDNREANI